MFEALARDRGIAMTDRQSHVARRAQGRPHCRRCCAPATVLFPGAAEFIRQAAAAVPIAIASGALRHEIEEILDATGSRTHFTTIVAAGDTPESKPSPAPYALAFDAAAARARDVDADSAAWRSRIRGGDSSRRAAPGLRCVGVTNSYPASRTRRGRAGRREG